MALSSWTCEGCTNVCYRLINGEVRKYCRPTVERGYTRREWITDDFIDCLDKTTDPDAEDPIPRVHEDLIERR